MAKGRLCVTCGGAITSHGRDTKQCGTCFAAARVFCSDCGVELDKRNQRTRQCRPCWLKAHPPRFCEACGERMPTGTRVTTKRCASCRSTAAVVPACQDCGVTLPKGSRGTRCWDCHQKARGQVVKPTCMLPGCSNPHRAKGLCMSHYVRLRGIGRNAPSSADADLAEYRALKMTACRICGYDRLPPDIHRVIHGAQGGKYVRGNMVALCSRCHDEVHRGLTPCPEPLPSDHVAHP